MELPLDLSDFRLRHVVCEVRYQPAYLIFDKTGAICKQVKEKFPTARVESASPQQTQIVADEGAFAVELEASRVTSENPRDLNEFAHVCGSFFNTVVVRLEIKVFTRIGLRLFYIREVPDLESAREQISRIKALNVGDEERFGIKGKLSEASLRWESTDVGTTFRLKAEAGKVEGRLPEEAGVSDRKIQNEFRRLILDVDYYTVAPVERSQWDAPTWIPSIVRLVRKESNRLLEA